MVCVCQDPFSFWLCFERLQGKESRTRGKIVHEKTTSDVSKITRALYRALHIGTYTSLISRYTETGEEDVCHFNFM